MYNNSYMPQRGFNQQNMYEQIDNQINQLQQMREQMRNNQQPSINQTFQIAPTHQGTMKYANSMDDVSKEIVFGDTPFFSKDLSVLWIKNTKGEIRAYTLAEIVQKDEKDLQIEFLQAQIDELKKGMKVDESSNEYDDESAQDEEPASTKTIRGTKKK